LCRERGDQARRLGGFNSHPERIRPTDAPDYPLTNARELGVFLAQVINETHRGQLDCKTASSIGQLATALGKVLSDIEDSEVRAKLDELQQLAQSRPTIIRNGHGPYLALTNDEMPRGEIKLNEPPDD
jgi:hypothetical protein